MDLKQIIKQYEKKTIVEIEKDIKTSIESSLESRKDVTFALYHLKTSGRFKENPLYKKSSFASYLEGVYNIREGSFNESVRAFLTFPKESVKYGVGLVSKIHRKCGSSKEKQVLKEIKEKEKSLKTPIKRGQIAKIITQHAKPSPPAKPAYKSLYENELRMHQVLKERYHDVSTELVAAKEQIEKLKKTIIGLRAIADAVNEYDGMREPVCA